MFFQSYHAATPEMFAVCKNRQHHVPVRLVRYWNGLLREVEHSVHRVDENGYSLEHPGHIRPALSRGWGRDLFSTLNYSVAISKEQWPVVSLPEGFKTMTAVRCRQCTLWVCDSDCCNEFCLDVVMSYHIQYSSLLFLSQFCMIVSFLYYLKVFLL